MQSEKNIRDRTLVVLYKKKRQKKNNKNNNNNKNRTTQTVETLKDRAGKDNWNFFSGIDQVISLSFAPSILFNGTLEIIFFLLLVVGVPTKSCSPKHELVCFYNSLETHFLIIILVNSYLETSFFNSS